MSAEMKDHSDYTPYADGQANGWQPDKEKFQEEEVDEPVLRRHTSIAEGQVKHNKLGWKRLTVSHCYIPPISLRHTGCCGCY